MKIRTFHHAGLKCRDIEKSTAFYEALGMKRIVEWGTGEKEIRMLEFGDGGRLELFANGGEAFSTDGKWIHLAFAVADVEEAFSCAVAAGASVLRTPARIPLDSRPEKMTIHVAFVAGPDGEQIEFFEA